MIYSIEYSPPDEKGLALLCINSSKLKGRIDVSLTIPENQTELPLVTLLHGVYGSHWCWNRKGQADQTLYKLIYSNSIKPMMLVMPSDGLQGDGSGYLNELGDFLSNDLSKIIQDNTGIKITRQYITGLSMGGWGAILLAKTYPHIYSAASAHSSITKLADFLHFKKGNFPFKNKEISPIQENWHSMPFRFDCGKDDPLIDSNRALHKFLKGHNFPHQYEELEGSHDWDYWKTNLEKSLKFFNTIDQSFL